MKCFISILALACLQIVAFGQVNNYITIDEAKLIAEKRIAEIYGQSFLDSNVVFDAKRSRIFYPLYRIPWERDNDLWNDVQESYYLNLNETPKIAKCFMIAFDVIYDSIGICDNCLMVHVDSIGNIIRPFKNDGLDKIGNAESRGNFKLTKQDYINVASKYGYNIAEANEDRFIEGRVELTYMDKRKNDRFVISVKYCVDKKGGWLTKEWLIDPWTLRLIKKSSTKWLFKWFTSRRIFG